MLELPPVDRSSAIELGYFRPEVEDGLAAWFARFLTLRSALWEIVSDVSQAVEGELPDGRSQPGIREDLDRWRLFLVGYGAGCLVVQLDRHLVDEVAAHTLVQRKLNEGSSPHRIPRKQFTEVSRSLGDPSKALLLYQAMRLTQKQARTLQRLREDAALRKLVGVDD